MIKKAVKILRDVTSVDRVELDWFDMQKPNICAITQKGVEFIIKAKYTHLHEKDILECEDGYTIEIAKSKTSIYILEFSDHITFAKIAYEIGNRHQPVCIEDYKITILDDVSLQDIIKACESIDKVEIRKEEGYFKPNGNAHHSH